MGYTLGQAAIATGKTKGAISKAIQKGRVSARKKDDGSYDIDPAELHRVYPPVSGERDSTPFKGIHEETLNIIQIKELEAKLDAASKENGFMKEQVIDLRGERDDWKKQAQTLLLAPPTQSQKEWFWLRWMKRPVSASELESQPQGEVA